MSTKSLYDHMRPEFTRIDKGHHIYVSQDNSHFVISLPWMHPDDGIDHISESKLEKHLKWSLRTISDYALKLETRLSPYYPMSEKEIKELKENRDNPLFPDYDSFFPTYYIRLDKVHQTSRKEVSKLRDVLASEISNLEKKVSAWDSEKVDKSGLLKWGGAFLGAAVGVGIMSKIYPSIQSFFNIQYQTLLDKIFTQTIYYSLSEIIAIPVGFGSGADIAMIIGDHRRDIKRKLGIYKRFEIADNCL